MSVAPRDRYGEAVTLGDRLAGHGAMRAVVDGVRTDGRCVIRHTDGLGPRASSRSGIHGVVSAVDLARSQWRIDRSPIKPRGGRKWT